MTNIHRRWLGNSLANLIGGVAAAGVNVLLPGVVARHLSTAEFSVWNLSLQMLLFANLLSLGLQTATARAIAHAADEDGATPEKLAAITRAALSIAQWATFAGFCMTVVLVMFYPMFFRVAPGTALLADFRIALLLLGSAATLQILAQVYMGTFQGLHRNIVFVGMQMSVRLLSIALVWAGVLANSPLTTLAALMAASMATLLPAMMLAFRKLVPWALQVTHHTVDRAVRLDLLRYCGSLSVWSLSMLFVNSTGIILVGRLNFQMAGAYGIALTAATVLAGLLGAILSPLMTTTASLYASESTRPALPRLLLRTTMAISFGLNLFVATTLLLYPFVLKYWVGASFVSTAGPLLVLLVSAHCLRNIGAPYAMMLLATGLHTRALLSAVAEALTVLVASIIFGLKWGAVGVAAGTLTGAAVGIGGALLVNTWRTPELTPQPVKFVLLGFVTPILLFSPIYVFLLR